ncbi:MAG: hypothetical protein JWN88_732 [Frankiales bacterium]|nr:hypothetical protein [Frankiales bacterium]
MRLPGSLQKLDDRVLGDRGKPRPTGHGPDEGKAPPRERRPRDGAAAGRRVLATVYRVARLVFLVLALIMVLGIVLTLAPSNPGNVIVRNVLELAEAAAGPFKDVFTQQDPERQTIVNYALAAVVYVLAATLVRKLPGGKS